MSWADSAHRPGAPRIALSRYRWTGFTLLELLIVIAIISLLMAIILTSYAAARARARDTVVLSAMVDMTKAASACTTEGNHLGIPPRFPPDDNTLCQSYKWVDISAIDARWSYDVVREDREKGTFIISAVKGAGVGAPAIFCTESGCVKQNW